MRHLWLKAQLLVGKTPHWLGKGLLMLLALTLIWGVIAWNLMQEHRRIEAEVSTDANNLARTFEENLLRSVEAIDQELIFLRALYIRDPAHFDFSTVLHDGNRLQGRVPQMAIFDRQGFLRATALGPASGPIDLSDREHFRVHLTDSADVLFVGKPVISRTLNKLAMPISRKILDADGRFAGVIAASPRVEISLHRRVRRKIFGSRRPPAFAGAGY